MSTVESEVSSYCPESINRQLLLGKSRVELAETYGHKSWKTVDMFMRRRGYSWNGDRQVYEFKSSYADIEEVGQIGTKKALLALKLFNEGKDSKEVASLVGF